MKTLNVRGVHPPAVLPDIASSAPIASNPLVVNLCLHSTMRMRGPMPTTIWDAARCVFPFRLCAIRSLSNHGSRICRDCAARLRYIHTWMDTSFIQAHWIFQRVSLERMAGHSTSHSSGNNMLPPKVPI